MRNRALTLALSIAAASPLAAQSWMGDMHRDVNEVQKKMVDLAKAIDRALGELTDAIEAAQARVDVGELPSVHGDAAQLARMMWHLIDNALKFRGDHDGVRVTVSASAVGDGWEIRVADDGPGLTASERERVLGVLRRSAHDDIPGVGIGLAICRSIAERHGGSIVLEPAPDGGLAVVVTLPESGR